MNFNFYELKMNNLSLGFVGVGLMGLSLIRRLSYFDYKIEAYDKNLKKTWTIKNNNKCQIKPKCF